VHLHSCANTEPVFEMDYGIEMESKKGIPSGYDDRPSSTALYAFTY